VALSIADLEWLARQHEASGREAAEAIRTTARETAARHVPAWAEPYLRLDPKFVVDPCPQVVAIDFPAIALTRAEWLDGALYLSLLPFRPPDPSPRWTSFSIKGAEPRLWDLAAPNGTTVEVTGNGIHVRTRFEPCNLTFTPGSY